MAKKYNRKIVIKAIICVIFIIGIFTCLKMSIYTQNGLFSIWFPIVSSILLFMIKSLYDDIDKLKRNNSMEGVDNG